MRILPNVTHGDATVTAAYAAKSRAVTVAVTSGDTMEISAAGRALQEQAAAGTEETDNMDWLKVTDRGDGKFTAHFRSSGEIAGVLKKGYMVIDGKKVMLDKEQMKNLSAAGKAMEKDKQNVANTMMMEQQLASARQSSDSWKKATQQQARAMSTAMRIMKGRTVSMADEKELAEMYPDLYGMAKSAATLKKLKESREQREESERISKANDKEREWENEPKDYSTPPRSAYPDYETRVSVDMGGEAPQVSAVGEVTIPPTEG